ncbi:MAG TPA: SCP2 sterol-binding domain-containing protein [Anaerolineae bacterium]|nr:SCP2 sterol-binding domain-containing protein [Anaerolineae bacterium]
MATQERVLEILEAMKERLDDPAMRQRMGTFTKSVQFDLTDLDVSYVMEVEEGQVISLEEATVDSPDIQVTSDSDVLVGIATGEVNTMSAFMSGKLQVNASFPDLLKLQQFFQ